MKRGDVYDWDGVLVTVMRVAKDGTWVDVHCTRMAVSGRVSSWTKRMRLPLSSKFKPLGEGF